MKRDLSLRRAPAALSADVRRVPAAWVYLALVLVWGFLMVVITPPFQVPDEMAHYHRAWSVAYLQIVAGPESRVTLPDAVATLPLRTGSGNGDWSQNAYSPRRMRGLLWEPIGASPRKQMTPAAAYGPIGYLPQAAGMAVARILGHSPLLGFYLGRLGNLIVAALLTFLAIRLIPFGKALLALIALFPIVVFEMASLSPDGLALSGFFLFLAVMLRLADRESVSRRDAIVMTIAAIVLLNAKPGSAALVLLVFMLRPRQFGSVRAYALWTGIAVLGTVGLTAVAMATAPGLPPDYLSVLGKPDVHPGEQLGYIVDHPWGFAKVLYRTMDLVAINLAREVYGILGWLSVGLPVIGMAAMGLGGLLLLGTREPVTTTAWRRAVMCTAGLAYSVGVSASLYVGWSALMSPIVVGLQGRYFIPVVALGAFAVYGLRPRRQWVVVAVLVASVAAAAVTTIAALLKYYY